MNSEIITTDLPKLREKVENISTDLFLIITEPTVWKLYGEKIKLKKSYLFEAPSGEEAKTMKTYHQATEFFIERGIYRQAHILALGGGALSDLAGFVAATLLRGLSWSVIPTTLLSMVDSSLGGKVGLNSHEAKNQIGAFHAPSHIFLCHEFLNSLPSHQKKSGQGEIIKSCFLSQEIFHLVQKEKPLQEIIWACAQFKRSLTQKDFREQGSRQMLNLGHSFGHALEMIYSLPHGIAVYWGMALIFKIFQREAFLPLLKELGEKLGLSPAPPPWQGQTFPSHKILECMRKDKKKSSPDTLELILVKEIGHPVKKTISFHDLETLLNEQSHQLEQFKL